MNKVFAFLALILIGKISFSQKDESLIEGQTFIQCSFYHAGSYSKERPAFYLQQDFHYVFGKHFSAGPGIGFGLYPAAAALPLSVSMNYHFKVSKLQLRWQNTIGRNVKVGALFFSSYFFNTSFVTEWYSGEKIQVHSHVGSLFLFDQHGGKSISLNAGIGCTYKLIY